ncbi:Protein abhd16a [Tyrophagus putrescentiae]|nr:Protein abhd16a [Tyrophagus putrescentiae]
MSNLVDCILGPSLYRIFDENRSRDYVPFTLERYADLAVRSVALAKSLATLASPYIVYSFYRNFLSGPSDPSSPTSLPRSLLGSASFRLVAALAMLYAVGTLARGFFRSRNPAYLQFISTYRTAVTQQDQQLKKDDDASKVVEEARARLRSTYDYDFRQWPVDFRWTEGVYARDRVPTLLPVEQTTTASTGSNSSSSAPATDGPLVRGVSWLMAHTIGRIMLYPGSIGLLQTVLSNALTTGRQFLVENYQAKRYKLQARDGNLIDCIFADRRTPKQLPDSSGSSQETSAHHETSTTNTSSSSSSSKGNTLIICSEGNAGFYEIGVVTSPLSAGYSVLGWNHPGFGDSTGSPYPQNEINAFDAVINFAVTRLGFSLDQIYVFAWSIGGFPAAWAASAYPELKGIILDASFDDILPLARARMMPLLLPIVDPTIRRHFNLNVSAYLNRYPGPVGLVRRLHDEIIPLDPADPLRTNRGNWILLKLLAVRFPALMRRQEVAAEVQRYLHAENTAPLLRSLDADTAHAMLLSYIGERGITAYPVPITVEDVGGVEQAKAIILFMASRLLRNYNSTHCTPLPPSMFEEPFDLFAAVAGNASN